MHRPATALVAALLLLPAASSAQRHRATETVDWKRGAVCYEVFVRSFYDSDGDGIGPPPLQKPGRLSGALGDLHVARGAASSIASDAVHLRDGYCRTAPS